LSLKALPVKVPEEIYNRLANLAKKTHRTKTFYVREALVNYLEDLEDTYLALHRLEEPGKNFSMAEVAKEIGLTKDEEKEVGLDDSI
jgi:RHH-type rel operon transcriptional repressor/antitoxin RelB